MRCSNCPAISFVSLGSVGDEGELTIENQVKIMLYVSAIAVSISLAVHPRPHTVDQLDMQKEFSPEPMSAIKLKSIGYPF